MIYTFTKEPYTWLSNMELVDIRLKGHIFPSVEHAYVSEKRPKHDEDWRDLCSKREIPAKQLKVYARKIELRPDWEEVKLFVMEHCLRDKFNNPKYKTLLLETGNQNIQEGNYWNDTFWGVDLKQDPNIGENHLGRLIMKIREELRQ